MLDSWWHGSGTRVGRADAAGSGCGAGVMGVWGLQLPFVGSSFSHSASALPRGQ